MGVVVAGPEGSGTNLLTDLIRACGGEAEQRSLPHAEVWWLDPDGSVWADPMTGLPFPEGTRFVVIERDPGPTVRSVLRRRLAPDWFAADRARSEALSRLSRLPAIRVRYEELVADPRGTVGGLAAALDLDLPEELPEVRDENAKWTR